MMIGLITVVVIMQAMSATEAQRRQTTGSNSAESSGSIALQTIQRSIMGAGDGMTGDQNTIFNTCYGQTVNASNTAGPGNITLPVNSFAPFRIWDAATPPAHLNAAGFDANTDIIQIIGGGSQFFMGRGLTVGAWTEPTDFPNVNAALGVDRTWFPVAGLHSGDLVIVVQPTFPCRISQITSLTNQGANVAGEAACGNTVPLTVATAARIGHAAGNFNNFYNNCQQETSVWNGGNAFAGTSGLLYSLGNPERFTMKAFAIRNGQLTGCAPLFQNCTQAASWQVFSDGIVSLKTEYGFDADADQMVAAGEWTRATPTTNWDRLKAVRLVLVARNKEMERDVIPTADCAPLWSGFNTPDIDCSGGAPAANQVFLANGNDGANWNRYRYKVFETTVSLRNMFWSN